LKFLSSHAASGGLVESGSEPIDLLMRSLEASAGERCGFLGAVDLDRVSQNLRLPATVLTKPLPFLSDAAVPVPGTVDLPFDKGQWVVAGMILAVPSCISAC
jgi:hypothetical protein